MAAADQQGSRPSIVEGNQLRCPNCGQLGDPLIQFKPLDRPEQYRRDLNPVYIHLKRHGGCGHAFSPGDPWIIEAYLAGDLVPVQIVNSLKETVEEMRRTIEALRTGQTKHDDKGAVTA